MTCNDKLRFWCPESDVSLLWVYLWWSQPPRFVYYLFILVCNYSVFPGNECVHLKLTACLPTSPSINLSWVGGCWPKEKIETSDIPATPPPTPLEVFYKSSVDWTGMHHGGHGQQPKHKFINRGHLNIFGRKRGILAKQSKTFTLPVHACARVHV